jgi:hypothetical protein
MAVLALESDPAQAAAIRHIVCDVVHARLTLVASVKDALEALHRDRPDLVLLPTLVTPAEETELVDALRALPDGANIETLTTPVLKALEEPTPAKGWRSWVSRTQWQPARADETRLFAQRLAWSLQRAGEGQATQVDEPEAEPPAADPILKTEPDSSAALEPSPAPALPIVARAASGASSLDQWVEDTGTDANTQEFPVAVPEPPAPTPAPLAMPAASRVVEAPAVEPSAADRRAARRFSSEQLRGLRNARIKHGADVSVVDVSADGALVSSSKALRPNANGVLEITTSQRQALVPFRVLRCRIDSLNGAPSYIGACEFSQPLDMSDLVLPAPVDPKDDLRRRPAEGLDIVLKRTLDLHLTNDDCDDEWKLPDSDLRHTLAAICDGPWELQADTALRDLIGVVVTTLHDDGRSLTARESREARAAVESHLSHVLPGFAAHFSEEPTPATSPDCEGLYFRVPIRAGRPTRVLNVSVPQGSMLEDWQFRLLKASACLAALVEGPPTRGERRRHARVDGPFEGRRCGLIDTPIQVRDISEGGCFVHSTLETEVGRQLTLELDVPGEDPIAVKGEVVNSRADYGFGVRFIDVEEDTRNRLVRLIAGRLDQAALVAAAGANRRGTAEASFAVSEAHAC